MVIRWIFHGLIWFLIGGIPTPLKMELVSWDYDIDIPN